HNKFQIDGAVADVKNVVPLDEKFKAFGWEVFRCDGHKIKDLIDTIEKAKKIKGKPAMIIADTVKGKGVSFMEEKPLNFHGVAPNLEQEKQALCELCHIEEFEE
ncbi:MAG: transketolase, partial [bacterium]